MSEFEIQPTPVTRNSASTILRDAADIVGGARNSTPHGDKERSFEGIAILWNAYDQCRHHNSGKDVAWIPDSPVDVAWRMVLLKIARSLYGETNRDHFVDAAGYAAIAGELALLEQDKAEK